MSLAPLELFLRELPGWLLWVGLFLPVALLLVLIILFLTWKLRQVEAELAAAPDPRTTAYRLAYGAHPPHQRRRAGTRTHT